MNAQRKALEKLWKDRCTVTVKVKVTDPFTHLTDFLESPLLEDQPCKLSFETLTATGGDEAPIIEQSVKLFLSPDVVIPEGCKIVIRRFNDLEREFIYTRSGEAGVFSNHQEILLEPFKKYG